MLSKEKKKLAYARLEKTDRQCDGCANRIGRWTKKCLYSPEWDLCFCSKNGCAERVKNSPECSQCGKKLNPFLDPALMVERQSRKVYYCESCLNEMGDQKLPNSYTLMEEPDLSVSRSYTKEDSAWVKKGPHVVAKKDRYYNYLVVQPVPGLPPIHVAAKASLEEAFITCARHNQQTHTGEWGENKETPTRPVEDGIAPDKPEVSVREEEPWLYIHCPDHWEDLPGYFTKVEEDQEVKTRKGTNMEDRIRTWFRKRGVEV